MKDFFKHLKKDNILEKSFLYSGILIGITFIFVLIKFFSLPPFVPVFNQMPWGNERIGPSYFIFIPLLTNIVIAFLNYFICSHIYGKSPIMSRIFAVTTLLFTFLILIFSFVIIGLIS